MDGGGFTSELMADYDDPATMELGHAGDTRYVERRDGRHAYGGSKECVDSHADRYRSVHRGGGRSWCQTQFDVVEHGVQPQSRYTSSGPGGGCHVSGPGGDRGGSSNVDALSYWGRGDGQEGHARAWRGAQNENQPASPFGMQQRTGTTGQQRPPSPTANWNVNDVTDVGSRQRLMNSRSRSSSSPPVHRPTLADGLQSAGSMQVGVGHGTSAGWRAGHDAPGSAVGGGRCDFPAEETRQPCSERVMLVRICGEDDALMADASGVHKHKTKQGRFQWISDRMRDENFFRTSEECRKKWNSMRDTVALIRDKCERSGSAGYFNMTTEEQKEREVCPAFERPLWDAMEWWRLKASATCDNTLASEELGGSGSGEVTASNVGMMTAMEDSTTRLCDGLDRASSALARATTENTAMVSSRMGDMAVQISAVAGAMQDGNMVLQSLVAVMAVREHNALGEEITRRETRFYSVDVDGRPAVDLDVALGFARGMLSHVLFWVKKTGEDIPNDWVMLAHDIVGDIVLKCVENLATVHDGRLDMGASVYMFLDPPLVGRGYLHGEIRL
ncbi:hypothetical protein CBR_g20217 [Chara braunii]|uniref:Myb/SANT-like DNA-binding domain-containing protein n=1 Tax=Chara braunii TaxID=69332 RepID=A0A388KZV5_CHABU|nr:hypothetical protein CBR_g20217 [Chara braunii]|eukprot:GBG75586.1 hypothetical protein CBR_g20217 [Chara braunii]